MADFSTGLQLATALQAYAVKTSPTGVGEINRLLQASKLRSGSFDNLFPAVFSLHGLDIKEALEKAIKNKDITPIAAKVAIQAINSAMVKMSNKYKAYDLNTYNSVDMHLQEFIRIFNEDSSDLSSARAARMAVPLEKVKTIFSSPFVLAYSAGSDTNVASLKLVHNSFKNLREIVNRAIKTEIDAELTKNNITNSKLRDRNYLTTKIINWGHTQTNDSILTGKLLAEMISARKILPAGNNDLYGIIVKDFLQETGQENTVIKLHHGDLTKGDPNVLNLVIQSSIYQKVLVQNRRENQEDLGQLEKKWSLLGALGRNNLLKTLGVATVAELASKLLKVRSSPSALDNIQEMIVSRLTGKKQKSTKKTVPIINTKTSIKKNKKSIKLVTNNKSVSTKLRQDTKPFTVVDLNSLMVLINSNLAKTIQENMGDGSRRDVLNYRTGRFAESVEVKRLSESRNGMITAFYSYMKNPYATFSTGGRQEFPRSRDPKLLIAKSIREIAAENVINRMRSVLV